MPNLWNDPNMCARSVGSTLDRVPIVQSIVAGFAAWIASFVAVAVFVARTEDGDNLVGYAGNLLYNAHFVEVELSAGSDTQTQNLLAEGATELSEFAYYAVPIVVLLIVGIAIGRAASGSSPDAGAVAGAAIALGYFVLTIAGTFLFEATVEGGWFQADTTISPTLDVMTIVLMGILYPAVIGAIGGTIGSRL